MSVFSLKSTNSSKMLIFLLFVPVILVNTNKIPEPNCLRENVGALDAGFDIFSRYDFSPSTTIEDVEKLTSLFRTRFKRAHVMYLSEQWLNLIGNKTSSYMECKDFRFYFQMNSSDASLTKDAEQAIDGYRKIQEAVIKINSGKDGPVVGVYVRHLADSYSGNLEALEAVFGSKENSSVPIGRNLFDCLEEFKKTGVTQYLARLQFITCRIYPSKKPSAEESADEVIKTCDELRIIAHLQLVNVTAEIMCMVEYPSYGTTEEGVVGSVPDFQRFWCRIVQEVTRNKSHPQIIMAEAFERTSVRYKRGDYTILENHIYHSGWWRRRHATSFEASAFLEKVEELEGGREPGNCIAECSFCASREECCERRICHPDSSVQPFEKGPKRRVCQSFDTVCAPRPPSKAKPPIPSVKQSTSTNTGGSILTPAFIIPIIIFFLLTFAIVVKFLSSRKENVSNALNQEEIRRFFDGSNSFPKKHLSEQKKAQEIVDDLPYDLKMEIPRNSFKIYEDIRLGSGKYGIVLKGRANDEDVAVKTTLPESGSFYLKTLITELKMIMFLGRHDNIVSLVGASTSELCTGKLYLFLKLCPLGNLLKFLRNHRDGFGNAIGPQESLEQVSEISVTSKDLINWSIQIASAMGHLADKKVIHADIAARNILVFSKDQVKLTDFGLSRRLHEYANLVQNNEVPLPWRHMSLEALGNLNFSLQSDIWSFGVLLWEIFSLGKVPYPEHLGGRDFVELLSDGLRLQSPQHANPTLYQIMTSCWAHEANSRPAVAIVHSHLICALESSCHI